VIVSVPYAYRDTFVRFRDADLVPSFFSRKCRVTVFPVVIRVVHDFYDIFLSI
jgi:hypothetical protein